MSRKQSSLSLLSLHMLRRELWGEHYTHTHTHVVTAEAPVCCVAIASHCAVEMKCTRDGWKSVRVEGMLLKLPGSTFCVWSMNLRQPCWPMTLVRTFRVERGMPATLITPHIARVWESIFVSSLFVCLWAEMMCTVLIATSWSTSLVGRLWVWRCCRWTGECSGFSTPTQTTASEERVSRRPWPSTLPPSSNGTCPLLALHFNAMSVCCSSTIGQSSLMSLTAYCECFLGGLCTW